MTNTNKTTQGTKTTKGGNTMAMPDFNQILTELMNNEALKDIPVEAKVNMAQKQFDTMVALINKQMESSNQKEDKKQEEEKTMKQEIKKEQLNESEMDQFMEFTWNEIKARGRVTAEVGAAILHKYATRYGVAAENMAKYSVAFANYFDTDKGEKDVKKVGKDLLALVALSFGKALISELDVLVDAVEIAEDVVKAKTVWDTGCTVMHAHGYAKKNRDTAVDEVRAYGRKQKLLQMLNAAMEDEDEE